jgi:hypothetical protein
MISLLNSGGCMLNKFFFYCVVGFCKTVETLAGDIVSQWIYPTRNVSVLIQLAVHMLDPFRYPVSPMWLSVG